MLAPHCAQVTCAGATGSAFFVHSRFLLTAAHNVASLAIGDTVRVVGERVNHEAVLVVREPQDVPEQRVFPDVALLELDDDVGVPVTFDYDNVSAYEKCLSFGYPIATGEGGEHKTLEIEGQRYLDVGNIDQYRLGFRDFRVVPGVSGSPVIRDSTGGVIGLLTLTRDRTKDEGGYATPVEFLVRAIPQLLEWQPKPTRNIASPEEPVTGAAPRRMLYSDAFARPNIHLPRA